MSIFREAMEPMAVISTAHLLPDTMTWIEQGGYGSACHPNEYGAFLYVGQDDGEDTPPDLAAVLAAARAEGVVWVKFDADASTLDGLPDHSDAWENAPRVGTAERSLA